MALTKSYFDLDVFNKAFDVSIEIHEASLTFPKIEQYALANQIRRASKSICANIAEGFGKQFSSPSEFQRFLSIALGSANEMIVWIRYSKTLEYIDEHTAVRWTNTYDEICRMLNGLHKSISQKKVSSNQQVS